MKIQFYFILLIFFTGTFFNAFAQNNNEIPDSSFERLSRFRLSAGFVNLYENDNKFSFRHPFLNLSFRSSGFDRNSSGFKINFAFEPGINGLIVSKKGSGQLLDYSFYFLPYAKVGPEIRLGKNVFIAGSFGIAAAAFTKEFVPFPFFGMNGFYLYNFNKKFYLEIETGVHSIFATGSLPLLFYFTLGIALL